MMLPLTSAQSKALEYVHNRSQDRLAQTRETLDHLFDMSALPLGLVERVKEAILTAPVCLHFHPDRLNRSGIPMLESLLQSGSYGSQFETGTSGGSVSAWPGGARYDWEAKLFGGAYTAETPPQERPKYGALDLLCPPDGPAPRFGSCRLVLKPEVTSRCTFTYLDSYTEPKERGTLENFEDILAALFTECFERNYALGLSPLKLSGLVEHILSPTEASQPFRNLDHYIEAQVHGPLHLARDVDSLVADSSFRGTPLAPLFEELANRYRLALRWQGHFELPVAEVPTDFRGAEMPELAREVAGPGPSVNAHLLGEAAKWPSNLSPERLQLLKRLWHVMVKFGHWIAPRE